jgi:2-hydroxy-6-oxonona-2,4-dienedioate hydrolase
VCFSEELVLILPILATMVTVKEHYVTVDGNKIRYLEEGNSGTHVVLIHGLGSQAERWLQTIPHLSKNHRVIAPDLIGFGLSDKPPVDYTPEYFVKFVFSFLEELGISKTIMIGSSLGGQIVAESAAASENNTIQKIILVSPTGTMRTTNPTLDTYIMAGLYPRHDMIKTAYQMMAGKKKDVEESTIERFRSAMSQPNAKMSFLSSVINFKNGPVITQRLQMISVPTLVIWGREDTMIPINYANDYVSNIKDCKFVVMEGCGHRPHVEDPEKFSKIILKFLGNKM